MKHFSTVLDSADNLSLDEQAELAEILRHRIAEKRRAEIVAAVKEARAEFAAGKLKPATARAIFNRLLK
ncbi:MAG TPA: hypothetical protein VKX17_05365 [Planctomycetota bacterium]|nr:hypothetical protein [Planctomycetota bacterium]